MGKIQVADFGIQQTGAMLASGFQYVHDGFRIQPRKTRYGANAHRFRKQMHNFARLGEIRLLHATQRL